jgi:hypothetical protein
LTQTPALETKGFFVGADSPVFGAAGIGESAKNAPKIKIR